MGAGRIAIIGGGAAAAWLVLRLLGGGADDIVVIEPRAEVGRGLAYSARLDAHLLNVPANKMDMDAAPGDPLFADWLEGVAPEFVPEGYAPRRLYGDFLTGAYREATAGRNVRHVRAVARSLERGAAGWRVGLSTGEKVTAAAVVLALGNLPPRALAPHVADPRVMEDPWAPPPDGGPGRRVVVAGTGLTALDAVLGIAAADPAARFTLAAAHPYAPPVDRIVPSRFDGAALVGRSPAAGWGMVRAGLRAEGGRDWYEVIDGVRPHVEAIWRGWSEAERRRFWRHGARPWLHHRHRTAPATAAAIDALVEAGRLTFRAGRVGNVVPGQEALSLAIGGVATTADLLVNATGPSLSLGSVPLLADAMAAGLVTPDPLGLGIRVDTDGAVIGAGGAPQPGLYALGPLTRGAFFEIVAVPHVRAKAGVIAARLTA